MPYQGEEDGAPGLGGSQACGHTCRGECLQPQPLLPRSPSSSGAQTYLCLGRNSWLLPPEWLLCLPHGKAAGEVALCKQPVRSLWCVSKMGPGPAVSSPQVSAIEAMHCLIMCALVFVL